MFRIINRRMTKITWKQVLLYLVLSQTVFFVMQQVTIPRILQESDGMTIFDVHFLGYSYGYALRFLTLLSKRGYLLYQYAQIPLDLLFPVLNFLTSATFFLMLVRTYRRLKHTSIAEHLSTPLKLLFMVPLTGMISDYLENVMVFIMLSLKTTVLAPVVAIASIFTVTKTIFYAGFYIISFVFLIVLCINWIKQKQVSYPSK